MADAETQNEEVQDIIRQAISDWAGNFLSPIVIRSLAEEIVTKLEMAEFL